MVISVRPVDYDTDGRELVAVLQSNLPHLPHGRLFPWLYLRNPEGRALAWVAVDAASQRMLGVAAAFPRRFYCSGEGTRGYLLGDFCVDPSHRSLGLAIRLQRACLEGLAASDADFVFDFPSQSMLAVYKRLQIAESIHMIRYAKPLRAERKVAERVPIPAIARALSSVANAGLRWRDRSRTPVGGWAIAEEAGPWGGEFTAATRRWSSSIGVCVARTAEYLNWRYREHPGQQYRMLVARQDAALGGYLVYHTCGGEDCTIDDLLGADDSVCSALLVAATGMARANRAHTLSAPWLSSHAGGRLLQKHGFRPRESSPVVIVTSRRASNRPPADCASDGWHLTHGDWES
jgi:GNAT superfamily N-acetyltransferase